MCPGSVEPEDSSNDNDQDVDEPPTQGNSMHFSPLVYLNNAGIDLQKRAGKDISMIQKVCIHKWDGLSCHFHIAPIGKSVATHLHTGFG